MITVQINLQFTVTVYEADSTTYTESDSTVCYEESDNDSLSSGPMFVEDTYDTDNDDDDELPHIEVAEVEGPGPVVHGVEAAAAAAPDPNPDAHPMHSDCKKCKCVEDNKDKKKFFFLCIFFYTK